MLELAVQADVLPEHKIALKPQTHCQNPAVRAPCLVLAEGVQRVNFTVLACSFGHSPVSDVLENHQMFPHQVLVLG